MIPGKGFYRRMPYALYLWLTIALSACGGGGGGESNAAGNQPATFSVEVTNIEVRRLDNAQPVTVDGSLGESAVITLQAP